MSILGPVSTGATTTPGPVRLNAADMDKHFPFERYRPGQREAIEFAVRAFNDGKEIVIIEGPTGAGKSGIAWTVADMMGTSYYLTITKVLQDQLVREFGERLVELKGRASYPCTYWSRRGPRLVQLGAMPKYKLEEILKSDPDCGEGYCRTDCPEQDQITSYKCAYCFPAPTDLIEVVNPKKVGRLKVLPPGMQHSACPYYEQVYKALESDKVAMNFAAFLYQTQMTNRFDMPRDLLVLDECLHPHTRVVTENGLVAIGKLVNEQTDVNVLSRNPDSGKLEYKPITRWLKRGTQMTYRVLAGNRVLYPTADHKIYTPSGTRKLGELRVGDEVYTLQTEVTPQQRQLVLGSLLGDANIHLVESRRVSKKYINKGMRARVRFRHGPKQEEYINWKFRVMSPHAKTAPSPKASRGYTKTTLAFNTSCDFYETVACALEGEIKSPSLRWLQEVDELGLAVWYMDDGSLSGGVANFHTNGFSRDECELIAGWLVARFGFPARVLESKKQDGRIYPYISIGRDGAQMLAALISKYVPPSMRYKLPATNVVTRLAVANDHFEWLVGDQQFYRFSNYTEPNPYIILIPTNEWRRADKLAREMGGSVCEVYLHPNGQVWHSLLSSGYLIAQTPYRAPEWDRYDPSIEEQSCSPVSARRIRSIDPYKESTVYDLEVADNHNYFAGSTLVSNCHQIEPILLDFVSLTLDDRLLSRAGYSLPEFETAQEYAFWFAENRIDAALAVLYKEFSARVQTAEPQADKREAVRELDDLGRVRRRFTAFMDHMGGENPSEWVCEFDRLEHKTKPYRRVTLRPVTVNNFTHDLLFRRARRVLMVSATVLDVTIMCESLGIDRSRVAAYRMQNRFPVEHRPIYIEPAARIVGGRDKMPEWGPLLVDKVNDIVNRDKYTDKRGIIHTHNFAIADLLFEQCDLSVRRRLTYQKRFRDRAHALEYHATVSDSILIAPAMHEGVDLFDDLSRFQIICKVPYPNPYENKQLARRMEIDPRYYKWLTALKLVQSYGRSVRSADDWADTFIIDQAVIDFLREAGRLIPAWFLEAVRAE